MNKLASYLLNQSGVSAVFIALILLVLLAAASFAIDIGYLTVVRNELQNTSDSSALAATRQLGHIYEGMTYAEQQAFVLGATSEELIDGAATDIASKNTAGGHSVTINVDDILIGTWDTTRTPDHFFASSTAPTSVRVTSRRDSLANGPISTFIAKVFGVNTMSVRTTATAALTGLSEVGPGALLIPVGISKYWFTNHSCNQPIRFHPTNDPTSCAGWDTYYGYDQNANDADLRRIIKGLQDGSYTSPEVNVANPAESTFNFTNGSMSNNTFDAFNNLFNYMRTRDDDGNDEQWTAAVPVYDKEDCSAPNGQIRIIGFATVVITSVVGAPDKIIDGYVICELIEPGRGGGFSGGTLGSIPGLVQ